VISGMLCIDIAVGGPVVVSWDGVVGSGNIGITEDRLLLLLLRSIMIMTTTITQNFLLISNRTLQLSLELTIVQLTTLLVRLMHQDFPQTALIC